MTTPPGNNPRLDPLSSNSLSGKSSTNKQLILRRDSTSELSSFSSDSISSKSTDSSISYNSVQNSDKIMRRISSTDFPQTRPINPLEEPKEFLISYPVMGIQIRYIIRKFISAVLDLQMFISKYYAESDKEILIPLLNKCRFEILRSDFAGKRRTLERIIYKAAEELKAIFKDLVSRYIAPFDLMIMLERVIKNKSNQGGLSSIMNIFSSVSSPISAGKALPHLIKVPSIDFHIPSISPDRVCEVVVDLFTS